MNNKFIMGAIIGAAAMYLLTNMGKGQIPATDTPIKVPPIKKQIPLPSTIPTKSVIVRGLVA